MSKQSLMWQYVDWLEERGFKPVTMVTFTFRDTFVHPDRAWGMFKKWLKAVNVFVEGRHYKRKWKHCYFSYVIVPEFQGRGTIHFHMLVDNWFPWEYGARLWWRWCGFIKIEAVNNPAASIRYVLKYVLKSGNDPVVWLLKNKRWDRRVVDLNKVVDAYLAEQVDFSANKPGVTSLRASEGSNGADRDH